ncbi:MAG: C25 family cysteine peptidase, partial [Nitrospirae bacterium]|nr:C25 family cysteine peptidase [Nitrospirota bacterium]
DATNIVNKILNYEQAGAQAWNKQMLFVADNEASFESVDDTLVNSYLPDGYQAFKVYLSQYSSTAAAKSDLINYIDNGQLITVYVGHGSVENWSASYLFTASDVPSLSNSSKPTFVVTLTCLNGFFATPTYVYCLGETFINGGAKANLLLLGQLAVLSLPVSGSHGSIHNVPRSYLTASSSMDTIFWVRQPQRQK